MPHSHQLPPDEFCRCLADATRARITLLLLQENELCVCELTYALDASQPKISRHLALLREAGLLADRRQGQWIYYCLHPALPKWIIDTLNTMHAANSAWLAESHQRLGAMEDRPARCC